MTHTPRSIWLAGWLASLLVACAPLTDMSSPGTSRDVQPSSQATAPPDEATATSASGHLALEGTDTLSTDPSTDAPPPMVQVPQSPALTGDRATDARNWLNYRRQLSGVPPLTRNAVLDMAAMAHAEYMRAHAVVTHEQMPGMSHFTGETAQDRLTAAGYAFNRTAPRLWAEAVLGSTFEQGSASLDRLFAAIYSRYALLAPNAKETGSGATGDAGGTSYLTLVVTANNGLGPGVAAGKPGCYPFDGQQDVPTSVTEELEVSAVSGKRTHGYPVSLHANVTSTVTVQSFTIKPRGGSPLQARLLIHATDPRTPGHTAALVPFDPLAPSTSYDVAIVGAIDGVAMTRTWAFTTAAGP